MKELLHSFYILLQSNKIASDSFESRCRIDEIEILHIFEFLVVGKARLCVYGFQLSLHSKES